MVDIFFAGIGSRETPEEELLKQKKVAKVLAKYGIILRSGGAPGADTAFEEAYQEVNGKMEIWLPWKNFNGRKDNRYLPTERHSEIAATLHPAWPYLKRGPRALHSRNVGQVLGMDLVTPVAFVLCWTKDGACTKDQVTKNTGGTGTAIKLASSLGIPVINMKNENWLEELKQVLSTLRLS